jgi:hypothetical protein
MIRVPETKPEVSFVRHAGQFACGKGKATHRHALPNIQSSRSVTMRVEISTTESCGLGPPLAVRVHGNHRRLREQRSIETSDGKNVFCSMPWLLSYRSFFWRLNRQTKMHLQRLAINFFFPSSHHDRGNTVSDHVHQCAEHAHETVDAQN